MLFFTLASLLPAPPQGHVIYMVDNMSNQELLKQFAAVRSGLEKENNARESKADGLSHAFSPLTDRISTRVLDVTFDHNAFQSRAD